ncbi:unnamed protein product [Rotaria magnacalcarata]|uniref:Uncharacterized protein n=1 Tax=Rotaria magnacalcarata TaxID=392030 RepID=A0A815Z491_9BILA|nr:unnamed protein product [Rotaria magnacalcarata]
MKLDNIDVLYSLFGINNQRLDILAQEQIFSNILSFVAISQSTDDICSISDSILNRFRIDILPRIQQNVKSLSVESASIECILGAGIYPNLTELKIFNFNREIVPRYFTDNSLFQHIDQQQITDLILISNENYTEQPLTEDTTNVYAMILDFFKNLNHLSILPSSVNDYSHLSLYNSSPMTFSSSTLTELCINTNNFNDCLALLDGRLKQLTSFIVQTNHIYETSTFYNMDPLLNLECFSLTCYNRTRHYASVVLPLLRRMSHLKELNLYIYNWGGPTFIAGTHLDNEILIHMPRLHTFTFYFASKHGPVDPDVRISNSDILSTFTNSKYQRVACMVDYFGHWELICRVFSLPVKFHRLEEIGNNIPNIMFTTVTHLKLWDKHPFKHEFFIRLTQAFPFLQDLSIKIIQPPFWKSRERHLYEIDWCSIVEYPYLVSLNITCAHIHYVEHFLNDTKTHLPRLTELKVNYGNLEIVTNKFTRAETRRNCAKIKQLIPEQSMIYPKDVYDYFPSLSL